MTQLPQLIKHRRRWIDVVAWTVWSSLSLAGMILLLLPESSFQGIWNEFALAVAFFCLAGSWVLGPVWLLLRPLPMISRLAKPDLRSDVAMTGLSAGEFVWSQLRKPLLRAFGPPLLPALAAIVAIVGNLGFAVLAADGIEDYMVPFIWAITTALLYNVSIAIAGAGWTLAAAAKGAKALTQALRILIVLGAAIVGLPFLAAPYMYHGNQNDWMFKALALLLLSYGAGQFGAAAPRMPRAAIERNSMPVHNHALLHIFCILAGGAATAGLSYLAIAALKGGGNWSIERIQLQELDLHRIGMGLILPFAAAGTVAVVRWRRWGGASQPFFWPDVAIGALAVAGGVWMTQAGDVEIQEYGYWTPNPWVTHTFGPSAGWWGISLPAAAMALMAARRSYTAPQRAVLPTFLSLVAAILLGTLGGVLILGLRPILASPSSSLDILSVVGLSALGLVLAAGFGVIVWARRSARRAGAPPPQAGALVFGALLLATLDASRWMSVNGDHSYQELSLASCPAVIAMGLAYASWRRALKVYFSGL